MSLFLHASCVQFGRDASEYGVKTVSNRGAKRVHDGVRTDQSPASPLSTAVDVDTAVDGDTTDVDASTVDNIARAPRAERRLKERMGGARASSACGLAGTVA